MREENNIGMYLVVSDALLLYYKSSPKTDSDACISDCLIVTLQTRRLQCSFCLPSVFGYVEQLI